MDTLMEKLRQWIVIALVALSLFLLASAYAALRRGALADDALGPRAVITVSGTGEAIAVPDVARITFSVRARRSDVPSAQIEVTEKSNTITKQLKDAGVSEEDMKTVGYNIYPQYEWRQDTIVCVTYPCPQPPGRQVFLGYDVVQTTEITIRDIKKAGEIVQIVGDQSPDTVSGPSFEVDDIEKVREEARLQAIEHARAQAEVLADALGVSLVRVLSFSDGGYSTPYYEKGAGFAIEEQARDEAVAPPEILPGETNIVSTVTIQYEIR